jgi:hypothetical protein
MTRSHSLEFLRERLWFALVCATMLCMLILYTLAGSAAFFVLGPAILFFLALTQFPRIYIWWNSIEKEKHPQYQRIQSCAQEVITERAAHPQFYINSNLTSKNNIALFASGSTHWFIAHPQFLETFSDEELFELLRVTHELFINKVTHRASLLSALQCYLRFLPWSHHRGSELSFYSLHASHSWHRLLFERSQQTTAQAPTPHYMAPNCLLPVLTNYSTASYYSLYIYLRDQWIERIKKELYTQEDV